MYNLKEKVTGKLSRLFGDSPSSSSPPPTTLDHPQATLYSKGGKILSSYFSVGSYGSKQAEDQHVHSLPIRYSSLSDDSLEESSDIFVEYSPVGKVNEAYCSAEEDKKNGSVPELKETRDNLGDYGQNSRGSPNGFEIFQEAVEEQNPQKSELSQRKPLADLTDESSLISGELHEFLLSCLPNIVKGCKWILLYSTQKHGISLRTLIRKSNDLSGPCLLIAGDRQGTVFGGLLECPLKPTAKRKYQGTSQTFVFTTLYGEPRLFRPTGANRYYYLCLDDLLALGGGGNFALRLDGDLLNGSSGPCDTFGNLCLAHEQDFELKNVELWGFTHASQYLV